MFVKKRGGRVCSMCGVLATPVIANFLGESSGVCERAGYDFEILSQ